MYNVVVMRLFFRLFLRRVWAVTLFLMFFVGCRPPLASPLPEESGSHMVVVPDAGAPDTLPPQQLPEAGSPQPLDAGMPDVQPDTGPPMSEPKQPLGCGSARPDMSLIVGADGLAIDRQGTIYWTTGSDAASAVPGAAATTDGFVGRMRPGAPAEPRWMPVPGARRLSGLALDETRARLYVLNAAGTIHWIDMSSPAVQLLVSALGEANDLALGPQGDLYLSSPVDRHIHRVSPAGVKSPVTTSPVDARLAPAGLTFAADGSLLVGLAGVGPIVRLTLAAGIESSRRTHGHYHAWGNGLAFDSRGRLYIATGSVGGAGRLVIMVEDESAAIEVASGPAFASITFGRGALDCKDLYIATPSAALWRLPTDSPGWSAP